ncbi:hypothetical protein HYT45_01710 [Candidatus Uhrbacteria bacterium]|nr:hypothetical protein [Candidatus Uhrbacteria bacterium]
MRKGFTVIELIIFIAAGALVLSVIAEIMIIQLRVGERSGARADIERSAATGLEAMRKEIQSAKNVIATIVLVGNSYASGPNALVLELPAVDSSGNLISGGSDFIVFERDAVNSSLLTALTVPFAGSARPQGTRIIANFVESLEFRYNKENLGETDAIDVTLVTAKTIRGENLQAITAARVDFRNKPRT